MRYPVEIGTFEHEDGSYDIATLDSANVIAVYRHHPMPALAGWWRETLLDEYVALHLASRVADVKNRCAMQVYVTEAR